MTVSKTPLILPLEGGERLSRHLFELRYQATSDLKKAQLIEAVVYAASPVRAKSHGQPHGRLIT